MSWSAWRESGCVVGHGSTPHEIEDLFAVAARDLKDSMTR